MSKLSKIFDNPFIVFRQPVMMDIMRWLPDGVYLKLLYHARIGKPLHLDNPKTFNEKLQWLKLHDRNPLYTMLVDKAEVKPWVAERIGWEHVVPTLGVWDTFDEIDFDAVSYTHLDVYKRQPRVSRQLFDGRKCRQEALFDTKRTCIDYGERLLLAVT